MASNEPGSFAIVFLILAVAVGLPLSNQSRLPQPPAKPENEDYNGDWKSDMSNMKSDMKFSVTQGKSGIIGELYRWRNGFYVQIDSRFSTKEYQAVNSALYQLSTHLCIPIRIWPQDSRPTGNYVFINKGKAGSGCWSHVGRLGGRQILNIQTPGCNSVATIIHETFHALGYFHEQSRPDRDNYVRIHPENVQQGMAYNFDKYSLNRVTTFGVPYDINSIMHYGRLYLSKNGKPTITANNGAEIGSRGVLTNADIAKLKAMYPCN